MDGAVGDCGEVTDIDKGQALQLETSTTQRVESKSQGRVKSLWLMAAFEHCLSRRKVERARQSFWSGTQPAVTGAGMTIRVCFPISRLTCSGCSPCAGGRELPCGGLPPPSQLGNSSSGTMAISQFPLGSTLLGLASAGREGRETALLCKTTAIPDCAEAVIVGHTRLKVAETEVDSPCEVDSLAHRDIHELIRP